MRVYMLYGTTDKEKCLGFVRTEAQAKKAVRMLKGRDFIDITAIRYEPEEIPTDKGGLVNWLNDFAVESTSEAIKKEILNAG